MESSHKIHLFENIALAFSGGGFRAASFCLGTLSYLDHFKWKEQSLLHHVKGLSTVSGGTITGAAYAVAVADNTPFNVFFEDLKRFLNGYEVLDHALSLMENEAVWKDTDKKHTLINAFSMAYYEKLTRASMDKLSGQTGHLEDICFNATEFSFGLAFRFQMSGDFGNYRVSLNKFPGAKNQIKVADAVASSSCFPLGFAPMIMPDDYLSHQSPEYKEIKKLDYFQDGIGIMDGGIVDNQGIGSTVLANNRRKKDKYDLVLVCDVASYKMEPWEQSGKEKEAEGSTLKQVADKLATTLKGGWLGLFVLLSGGALTWVAACGQNLEFTSLGYFLGGFFSLAGIVLILSRWLIRLAFRFGLNRLKKWIGQLIPNFFLQRVKFFDDLKFELLKRMIEERATSGMKMINEVFLKQIRRLNYDLLYKDDELINRRATALIYQLTREQFEQGKSTEINRKEPIPGVKYPSKDIFDCAQKASDMDTTLWFTPEDMREERLKNLIACGQFSLCYTLIRYLNEIKVEDTHSTQDEIDTLKAALIKDWSAFVKDPFVLLEDW